MSYTLTARKYGETETLKLEADSHFAATVDAVMTMLDRAEGSRLWSHGLVVLAAPDGEILHIMEEKDIPLCQAEIQPATRIDQAVMCEEDAEIGRDYCAQHDDWDQA